MGAVIPMMFSSFHAWREEEERTLVWETGAKAELWL
jgi:hypothetical protein